MTTYTAPPTQNDLVLHSGDHLNVDATGQAFDTSIHNGGVESVLSGGEFFGTTIHNGGLELVFAGGRDIETTSQLRRPRICRWRIDQTHDQ